MRTARWAILTTTLTTKGAYIGTKYARRTDYPTILLSVDAGGRFSVELENRLRTPKGWTCPRELDGHRLEDSWRAHQVPITDLVSNPCPC